MGRPPKKKVPKLRKLKGNEVFQAPRGMKDILPEEQPYWEHIYTTANHIFKGYGFSRITTPTVEFAGLFQRSVGNETDIVEKEMYSFTDRGGRELALRPEGTAGIVRAYIENGMSQLARPLKLYSFVNLFRYDRPQAGRAREHNQIDAEIIDEKDPVIDAQLIHMAWKIYQHLGLKNVSIKINSLGDRTCRPEYKDMLLEYYGSKKAKLCPDCRRRLKANPLRLLDCKEEKCQRVAHNAPQILDHLCDECHTHFKLVLEYLDELEVTYQLDTKLVRGQDYYTKTVFEFFIPPASETDTALALGGGGRYDDLVEYLGGKRSTPACGFGLGIERTIEAMKQQEVALPRPRQYDIYLVQLGELARKRSLKAFEQLFDAGYHVAESFSKGSIKTQLKKANRLGVQITLILGQKEAIDRTIIVRDMDSGNQENVPIENLIKEMKRRIKHPLP
jgi:histidyl-tRNA synthetase